MHRTVLSKLGWCAFVSAIGTAACGQDHARPLQLDASVGRTSDGSVTVPDAAADGHVECASPSCTREPDARAPDAHDAATSGNPPPTPVTDSATVSKDADVPADYPRGPYGVFAGDTVPDFHWQGYENDAANGLASAQPWVDYSMDDLRKSGRAYGLMHIADFDCPGCNHAGNDLGVLGKGIVDAGGAVVEVLGSHAVSLPATRPYLDAWIETHDLAVTSVIDAPGHELETLNTIGVRETALIIDLSTMKILSRINGDLAAIGPSSIATASVEMHELLGRD